MAEQINVLANQAQPDFNKKRLRNFCFTDFVTTDEHIQSILANLPYSYLIIGRETCPTTWAQHLQCYCELSRQLSVSKIKDILGNVHIEERRGTNRQAASYCRKEGNFMEYGAIKVQGKRNDLLSIRTALANTGRFEDVVLDNADLNQLKYAQMVLPYIEPKRDWKPEIHWYHGKSGTGKTRYATRMAGPGYYMKDNTKWWLGYDGHDRVVIDELRPNQFPFEYLLRLLDRYPFTVEYKGGSRSFLARKIWITCPMHPEIFCANSAYSEDRAQLLRRLDFVLDFDKPEISAIALEIPHEPVTTQK